MKALIAKHRPKDISPEAWEKEWEAQGRSMGALAAALRDIRAGLGSVKHDDFAIPNHYAMLVSDLSRQKLIDDILDMLPKSTK